MFKFASLTFSTSMEGMEGSGLLHHRREITPANIFFIVILEWKYSGCRVHDMNRRSRTFSGRCWGASRSNLRGVICRHLLPLASDKVAFEFKYTPCLGADGPTPVYIRDGVALFRVLLMWLSLDCSKGVCTNVERTEFKLESQTSLKEIEAGKR